MVLLLIGIIGSVATLSMRFGNQRDWQRQEAERVLALFTLASQEAMVRGMPIGLECNRQGYRFMAMTEAGWQFGLNDDIFRERQLEPMLSIALTLDNKPLVLADTPKANPNAKAEAQIVFTPDGDINPFALTISLKDGDETFTISNTSQEGLALAVHGTGQP